MQISLEKNFFAGYVTRDKGLTEGEMRECLQGQTEEGLYVHQQRGEKKSRAERFRQVVLQWQCSEKSLTKTSNLTDFHEKVKMKKKTGIIS